jgi:hypothetical protein
MLVLREETCSKALHVVGAAGGAVTITLSGVDVDSTAGAAVGGVVGAAAVVNVVV